MNLPLRVSLVPVLLWAAVSCAVNPATGRRELMLVSEGQEISMGREADPQIINEFGLYPDSQLQAYVEGLGRRLASLSERPHLPWTFRIVDDPIVNAFALPGGYIYISRGIMAYFNSEAELVSVLGHEIGHVTARHSAQQLTQQQLAQVGLVAGVILAPELADFAGLAQAGLGLLFLKFSRDDERQADDLGLRYMSAAGYEPGEMPKVFAMLARVSAAAGGGRVPGWLSTHPDPEDREERIRRQVAQLSSAGGLVNREQYLRRLEGMIFGANPRHGFFRDQLFMHPDLRFQIAFPSGWRTSNQRQGVYAQSPERDALIELAIAEAASPQAAVADLLARRNVTGGPVRSHAVNGFPAASARFRVVSERSTLSGLVTAIAYEGNVYRLIGVADEARWSAHAAVVARSFETFDRLTDRAALEVQPLRLSLVTLERPMTLAEFARRYPSQVPLATLALLNGVTEDTSLPAGTVLKRVVGGPLP
ncbi:MAG: peptidase M48 [Gemmatimonadales bacterium]|nr:MAG: peptidase M48 [Gemmatimonadales bacterium]